MFSFAMMRRYENFCKVLNVFKVIKDFKDLFPADASLLLREKNDTRWMRMPSCVCGEADEVYLPE